MSRDQHMESAETDRDESYERVLSRLERYTRIFHRKLRKSFGRPCMVTVDLKNHLKNTPPAPACSWGTTDNEDTDLNVE